MNINHHNSYEAIRLMEKYGVRIEIEWDADDYWYRAIGTMLNFHGEWSRTIVGAVKSLAKKQEWKCDFKERKAKRTRCNSMGVHL